MKLAANKHSPCHSLISTSFRPPSISVSPSLSVLFLCSRLFGVSLFSSLLFGSIAFSSSLSTIRILFLRALALFYMHRSCYSPSLLFFVDHANLLCGSSTPSLAGFLPFVVVSCFLLVIIPCFLLARAVPPSWSLSFAPTQHSHCCLAPLLCHLFPLRTFSPMYSPSFFIVVHFLSSWSYSLRSLLLPSDKTT